MRPSRVLVFALAGLAGCTAPRSEIAAPMDSASLVDPSRPGATQFAAATLPSSSSARAATARAVQPAIAEFHAPGCEIVVEELLDANVFRGSPSSPMKYDSYRRDPRYARMARGIDHGAQYLSCHWRVRVNDTTYHYEHTSHGGPAGTTLDAQLCSAPAEAQATANDIARFTDHCGDLHRGEYYGDVLLPDEAAPALGAP